MKQVFSLLFAWAFLALVLFSGSVLAMDVAYIVEEERDASQNIIDEIEGLGLTYELISEAEIARTAFSEFDAIVLSNGRIDGAPVDSHKSLILNPRYHDDWSLTTGSTGSNSVHNNQNHITTGIPVLMNPYVNSGPLINYLTRSKYDATPITIKDNTSPGGRGKYVVATKQNPRRVFFGISDSEFWSRDSKQLFSNSLFWIVHGDDRDGDGFFESADCNDLDALINPDATEIPYDGIDNDCSEGDERDVDNDGYDAEIVGGDDCDDADPLLNPGSSDKALNCVNDAPEFHQHTQLFTVFEGDVAVVEGTAVDYENDPITFSINDPRFILNESFESAVFEWQTSFQDEGVYDVRVFASDGERTSFFDATVEVRGVNQPPTCTGLPEVISWDEDGSAAIDLSSYCEDPDGGVVEYFFHDSSNDTFISLDTLDQMNGVATFSSQENWHGEDWIVFSMFDGSEIGYTPRINLVVTPVNDAPEFLGIPESLHNITWEEDTNLTDHFNLNDYFTDVDGDTLNFISQGDVHIDVEISSEGLVSFIPEKDWFGSENIVFLAQDPALDFVYSNLIVLTVVDANEPPVFENVSCETEILEDVRYSCELSATDVEGDDFSFRVGRNDGLVCEITGSTLTYFSEDNYFGDASCVIAVEDSFGSTPYTLNVTIEGVNDAPRILDYSPRSLTPKLVERVDHLFEVEFLDTDNTLVSIVWFLRNSQGDIISSFGDLVPHEGVGRETFTVNEPKGEYILEAYVGDENHTITQIWNITIGSIGEFTCSEVEGTICSEDQMCGSGFLGVSDSSMCCATTCSERPPSFDDADTCSDERILPNSSLSLRIEDPDSGESFEPGETITVEVDVFHDFLEDIDFDITASLYDLTEEDELEKEKDSVEVDEGDTETVEFDIQIDSRIEDNDHAIFVRVIDEDETICVEDHVEISVDREKDDVAIEDLILGRHADIRCGDFVSLTVEVENRGTSKQDDSVIVVENRELGIFEESRTFDLDEFDDKDDTHDEVFTLDIPSDAKEGSYKIKTSVVYDEGDEKTIEFVTLNLDACTQRELQVASSGVTVLNEIEESVVDIDKNTKFLKGNTILLGSITGTELLIYVLLVLLFLVGAVFVIIKA